MLELSQSVIKRLEGLIKERKITAKSTHKGTAFIVDADLEMMRVVLVNFITNAIKYAEKEIDVEVIENKKNIRVNVSNDGQTISADQLKKVWDEFYRLENATDNSRIGSTGLGLTIAKNILILHKAKYGCVSGNGRTTFWVELKKGKIE